MAGPAFSIRTFGPLDEVSLATSMLLDALDVDAAPQSVSAYLRAHPAFPSMAAVVDCLDELGVRASARKTDAEGLRATTTPALISMSERGGDRFWVLLAVSEAGARCLDSTGRFREISTNELMRDFRGVVLQPQVEVAAGEGHAKIYRKVDELRANAWRLALAFVGILVLGTALSASLTSPDVARPYMLVLLLAWVGFGASAFLSLHAVLEASGSSLLQKFCPSGARVNCGAVLGSRYGRLFGVIPVADLGAVLFAAEIATLSVAALAGWTRPMLFLVLVAHALLVPATLASLVVQGFVVRVWCWLCALVQVIVWAELLTAATAVGWRPDLLATLSLPAQLVLGAAGLAGAMSWALARPLVVPFRVAPELHVELERLRSLPEVIERTLAKTPPVPPILVPGKIVVGDPHAPLEILVVTNPFCPHCAEAHGRLTRLVESFPKLVRGAILFSAKEEPAASAARNILFSDHPAEALEAWFADGERSTREWMARGDHAAVAHEAAITLAKHNEVALGLGVESTPVIFVDGRLLGGGLSLKHVRFYLRAQQKKHGANGARPEPPRA